MPYLFALLILKFINILTFLLTLKRSSFTKSFKNKDWFGI